MTSQRNKVLRPTTIIPQNLYIPRAADRQLEQIVDDMGRPGYVLVARQMGKTNLLINMKRQRERNGDMVVYFDLSNRFETARAWFRNIIDSIVEGHADLFRGAYTVILEQRHTTNLEANVEYDRHLRLLLRAVPGKRLVIVLDEIDSLVNSSYSDIVLAQVRSMYFSRINYNEYELLTYVLSGVAEPVDLIKDKNISPFNIGEKIYLEDFSREEISVFVEKAGLNFDESITDRIYGWTCGNPRITWDVCAELENLEASGKMVSVKDVDLAVEKLYLTQFDRAPIDHIRALTEADPQIREAIIRIRQENFHLLDEKVKGRLYLAGIIRAANKGIPAIKNPIIDEALSDEWLAQLSMGRRSLLHVASEHFSAKRYEAAVSLFEEYLAEPGSGSDMPVPRRIEYASALVRTRQYERAVEEFRFCLPAVQDEETRLSLSYKIGSTLLYAGLAQESVSYLKEATKAYAQKVRNPARFVLGFAYMQISPKDFYEEATQLYSQLISDLAEGEATSYADLPDGLELRTAALYQLAVAHHLEGKKQQAIDALAKAESVAPPATYPTILQFQMKLIDSFEERSDIAERAAKAIIQNKLTLSDAIKPTLLLDEGVLADILLQLEQAGNARVFDQLFGYTVGSLYGARRKPFDIILTLVGSNMPAEECTRLLPLLWKAINLYSDEGIEPRDRLKAARLIAEYSPSSRKNEAAEFYIKTFSECMSLEMFSDEDISVIISLVFSVLQGKSNTSVDKIIRIMENFSKVSEEKYRTLYVAYLFAIFTHFVRVGYISKPLDIAREIVKLTEERQTDSNPYSDDILGMIANIRASAINHLEASSRAATMAGQGNLNRHQRRARAANKRKA